MKANLCLNQSEQFTYIYVHCTLYTQYMDGISLFPILFISKQSMAGKKSRRILGEIYVHLVKLEAEWIKIYI